LALPASPAFPGVLAGTNNLVIQQNGALRVTTHSLHLPSTQLSLSAVLVGAPGGPRAQLRTAGAQRSFSGGFDSFGLNLDAIGTITFIRFGRQRGSETFAKDCP